MKLFNNENAVSEVVGAMFILLIIVLFLGGIQAYEVPKWNKELEKQTFDQVYKDFLELSSDFEDSSFKNLPITASMHTGVRYPDRFSLRNPGQGAYGTITAYPVKINISYNSNGTIINENYTSLGMIYEMKGISDFPKLIYEHGIVIKDFGNWNNSDDVNNLVTENGVFIPFLKGIEPIYSTEIETFNILPVTQYNFTEEIFMMNVTLETKYPWIWAMMPPASSPPGSQYTIDNGMIRITDIPGFNLRNLSLPITSSIPDDNIYSGVIRFTDANTIIHTISNNMTRNITNTITNNFTNYNSYVIDNSSCSFPGRYIWDIYQGCVNLPKSSSINKFILQDIKMAGIQSNADFIFNARDFKNNQFEVMIYFNSNSSGDPTSVSVTQTKPAGTCSPPLVGGQVNLTSCYIAVGIDSPNVLKITHFDSSQILFVKFVVY
ncbi:MAG: hypothetical protein Q8M95_07500 [Candidatus Methanoperedens sp.]|nr:hypothetical protein [Candidatus Methanoperedens sp.]